MLSSNSEEKKLLHHSLKPRKGGLKTMPFIIVNESFERIASYGLMPNMIFYLMEGYHMEAANGSIILSIWSAFSNSLAIFGAFLSDSYLGRFRVIALGSISTLLGMLLLWLTSMIPQLKPSPCDQSNSSCDSPTATQLAVLFSSLGLMSIGAGCVRPCSIAFGADQFNHKENSNKERVLQSYINWYCASIGVSTVFALTIIVYIQDRLGWKVGFAVPAILMILSAVMFLLGSSLYVKVKASESLFTGFVQVLVVAFKNRKSRLPSSSNYDDGFYQTHESKILAPTKNLRFLNKACIIRDPERDINPDGTTANAWSLCSVEQVESLKAFLRVIPMWSTGVMVLVSITQSSYSTLQANTMERHITTNFAIPAGSYSVITVATLTIWIALYDRLIVPLLARFTWMPHGFSMKYRMGIGLVLSCVAMAISATMEKIRRGKAIEEGLENDPNGTVEMSAMWLVPQYMVLGLAEAFHSVSQTEFFYSHIPKTMSSIAVALYTLELAVANLVGGALVNVVDKVTTQGGKISWLSKNLNKGHVDYYYWLITFLNMVNFVYFLSICAYSSYDDDDDRSSLSNKVEEEEEEEEEKTDYMALPSA